MINRVWRFVRSPAGVSMTEHGLMVIVLMGTLAVLTRRMGLETVGLWALLGALINYARIGDVWSTGLLSYIGEARGEGRKHDAASFASTAIVTGAVGYMLLMAMGGMLIWMLAQQIVPEDQILTVRSNTPLLVGAYWLLATAGNYQLVLVGFGYPTLRAVQNIGGAAAFLIASLLIPRDMGLAGILIAQALRGGVVLAAGACFFHGYVSRGIAHSTWEIQKFFQLLRFGSKLFVIGAVQFTIEPLIKLLVTQFGGLAVTGAVEIVLRVVQGARGVVLSMGQVLLTSFARTAAEAGHRSMRRDYSEAVGLVLPSALCFFSLLCAAGPAIEVFFLGGKSEVSAMQPILWVFAMAWLSDTIVAPAYFLLMAQRCARPIFGEVVMRAGMIATLGASLGLYIEVKGVYCAVLVGFISSSCYVAQKANRAIDLPLGRAVAELLVRNLSVFIPLLGVAFLMILRATFIPDISAVGRGVVAAVSIVWTGLLIIKFGRLGSLYRRAIALRI